MDNRRPNRHRWMRRAALSAVGLLVLAACAGPDVSTADLVADGDPMAGEALYQNNCASCHGVDLQGTDKGPPHLDIVYEPSHHADISFRLAVERGVQPHHWNFGPMPAIEGLTDDEVTDIITYVREQQRAVGID